MTAPSRLSLVNIESLGARRPSFGACLGDLNAHVAAWIKTCADYYEAAAIYEQMSNLSDAELQRRGLSRAALARDACDACGSTAAR
jgi:hypothetical protein